MHTPGPWKEHSHRQIGPDAGIVCEVWSAVGGDAAIQQADANVRLIAAAPDLLEACETFAEWLRREESGFARAGNKRDTPEGERAWRDWYNDNLRLCALAQEQARAAIARATGASQ